MSATPRPWKAEGPNIRDANGKLVVVVVGPHKRAGHEVKITREIASAVNLHDEMRRVLREARDYADFAASRGIEEAIGCVERIDAVLQKAEEQPT